MKALRTVRKLRGRGFTLIELLVVVLIIGILAAIAVPQYFKVVEKGKAAEALQWIGTVQGAQESYLAQYGQYAAAVSLLPVVVQSTLNNFSIAGFGVVAAADPPQWSVDLQRNATPAVYSQYDIDWAGPPGSFEASGGNSAAVQSDLLPSQ